MTPFKSVAVFISGFGSNLNVFLQRKTLFKQLQVVSSHSNAFGLTRAQEAGVPHQVLSRPIAWAELSKSLKDQQIEAIFLAGFMRLLPAEFLADWSESCFNLHPSLLPDFKGLQAIERAYAARADIGVTIHRVVPEMDAGEIILQETALRAEELEGLSLAEVKARVQTLEHHLVAEWIQRFCQS